MRDFLFLVLLAALWTHAARSADLARGNLNCALSQLQYDALKMFFNATNGPNWCLSRVETAWDFSSLSVSAPCTNGWVGVTCPCSGTTYNVVELSLPSICLKGGLTSSLSNLTALTSINFQQNSLAGTIPSSLGELLSLTSLVLNDNNFVGTIPSTLTSLTKLQTLYLYSNKLTGSIPSNIGNLRDLVNFQLQTNELAGALPSSLGRLTNLSYFDLSVNSLSGSIPSSISQLNRLKYLLLNGNSLNGTIPSSIADLSALLELYLSTNRLSGSIPSSLGQMKNLTSMQINSNPLTGTIPSELGEMVSLGELFIYGTDVAGTIPSELGQLAALTHLFIYENSKMRGTIPSSFGTLSSLTNLVMNTNGLTGTIPSSLSRLTLLQELFLNANNLTGNIPSTINRMVSLQELSLHDNSLSGTIPSSIGSLILLVDFELYNNKLTGTLPSTLGNLRSVQEFYLYNNLLEGTIPPTIGQYSTDLTELLLYSNYLTGTIPENISDITSLEEMDVNNNALEGPLPYSIGNLRHLETLYLYSNSLSGPIPTSIGELTVLEILYAYDNELTSLPSTVGQMKYLRSLYISSNKIGGTLPPSLSQLSILTELFLYDNLMTGSIPSGLGVLPRMSHCYLYGNQLTGRIPTSFGASLTLTTFYLFSNLLTGPISSEVGNINGLVSFIAFSNYLSGSLPSTFGNATGLINFLVYSNYLSGELPSSFSSLTNLRELLLNNNAMSGKFFSVFDGSGVSIGNGNAAISAARRLEFVNIANNLFTGRISSVNFTLFHHMVYLLSASNCFSGSIPSSICDLENHLVVFDFASAGGNAECESNRALNRQRPLFVQGRFSKIGLDNTIPSCLFQFPNLSALHLFGNNLHGTIPSLAAPSMISLLLSNNLLTGTIPESIQRHAFTQLDLSSNRLDGTLVDDFSVTAAQTILSLSVNRLSGQLPFSFTNAETAPFTNFSTFDVLVSNVFDCDNSDIPTIDPNSLSYSCGSYELNVASYSWIGVLGGIILAALLLFQVYLYYIYQPDEPGVGVDSVSRSSRQTKTINNAFWKQYNDLYQEMQGWWKEISFGAIAQSELTATQNRINGVVPATKDLKQASILLYNMKETKAFLIILHIMNRWALAMIVICIVILIPVYLAMNYSGKSIVSFDYGYALSVTFLHGAAPVIFVGLVLIIGFFTAFFILRIVSDLFEEYRQEGRKANQQLMSSIDVSYKFLLQKYFLIVSLHSVNLIVTLTVNAIYIHTLIGNDASRSSVIALQAAIGLFKLFWNSYYIPWATKILGRFTFYSQNIQHRLVMAVINFILAPCVVTMAANKSCLYYILEQYPSITTSIALTICSEQSAVTNVCVSTVMVEFSSTSVPAFQYSYACGTALLEAYTPVLLYTYTTSGLVIPFIRHLTAVYEDNVKALSDYLARYKLGFDVNTGEVDGPDTIFVTMMNSTVLLTFGIASPILGIIIAVSILTNDFLSKELTGRILFRAKTEVESEQATMNSMSNVKQEAKETTQRPSIVPANILILEHLNMKDSWKIVFLCFKTIAITVCFFWALIFFDMIADKYGTTSGIIVSSVFGTLVPIMLIEFYLLFPMTSPWVQALSNTAKIYFHFEKIRKDVPAAAVVIDKGETPDDLVFANSFSGLDFDYPSEMGGGIEIASFSEAREKT